MAQAEPMESESLFGFGELQVEEVIAKGSLDFEEWTTLISETEKTYPEDIQKICLVYDSFLSEFPLCHGYWSKYAEHKTRLCTIDEVVEIFERAVESVPYSVDVWVDFCTFSMLVFEDPCDIRRLFQRAISFVGKDYLCHSLWDEYIQFEFSQKQWSSLANIYMQALQFPTKKVHHYYECFKKLVAFLEKETGCNSVYAVEESDAEPVLDNKVPLCLKNEEIASIIIKDLLDPPTGFARSKALQKYLSVGDSLYKEACQLDENICHFEANIRRSYFHVKPLDLSQLENWHHYLDFVEKQGDFDWAVKLYERCLIPCASYPEFWMRYTKFMESKGGREIANHAMDRSTQIFLKRVPAIHLVNSRFKEQIGDAFGARNAFLQCEAQPDSNFVENAKMKANMEKRLGNFEAASNVYKEALEMAATKKMFDTLPILYVHFSRLTYMSTGSADAARDILIDGIKHVPQCKLLMQELIKFLMMHKGSKHINVVDAVIAGAISPESGVSQRLDGEDLEDISSLYLEYVDLCGTIHDLMRAWNRHIRVFPHSLRAASSKHQAKDAKALNLAKEIRGETFVANSHQPSGDSSSNLSTGLPLQDKKISRSENPDTLSDHTLTNISEERLPSLENRGNEFESATIDQLQSEKGDNSLPKRSEQESPNGSGKPRDNTPTPSVQLTHEEKPSSDVPQSLKRDSPEPSLSSLDLVQVRELSPEVSKQPRESTYRENTSYVDRIDHVTHGNESIKASEERLIESDVQRQHDYESEHDMKPPSLENLSLNNKIDVSSDSIPSTSDKCEDIEEVSISNISVRSYNASSDASLYGSIGTQASARTENEVVNSSSPASHQNVTPAQPFRQQQFPTDRDGNWRQENNSDRFSRNSRFGFRGQHSQPLEPQGYSSQPQPPLNAQAEQSSEAQNQYQAAASQSNLTTHQAWAIQNAQQQSLAIGSEPQQPVSPASSQASQYPMYSSGQYGNVQNDQYNQMSQYYYYQQQPVSPASSQESQYPMYSSGQYGNEQNNQYNQMWQYYYYQQQQQQQLQLQQRQSQQQLQSQQQQYQPQLQENYQQEPPFQQQPQYDQQQQQQYSLYLQQQQSLQYQ